MTGGRSAGAGAPQAERVAFWFDPATTLGMLAAQRRRFAAAVTHLGTADLSSPSRCAAWSVADVLRHVLWADAALRGTWRGDRSLVNGFDPRRTPHEFVVRERSVPDPEIVERFCVSSEQMAADLAAAGPERFGDPGHSPLGDVPWWLGGVHLGWDTWLHERDVLVPLGRATAAPPSETVPVLAYGLLVASFFIGREALSVRLGPACLRRGSGTTEAWAADGAADEADGEDAAGMVELQGDATEIVDALSGRGELREVVTGPPEVVERLSGMARSFTAPT